MFFENNVLYGIKTLFLMRLRTNISRITKRARGKNNSDSAASPRRRRNLLTLFFMAPLIYKRQQKLFANHIKMLCLQHTRTSAIFTLSLIKKTIREIGARV